MSRGEGLITQAYDNAGNDIWFHCVDTLPADGVCDAPAACVNPPTINGTMNPAANVIRDPRASCS
jgi:hypothetical protein